MMLFHVTWFTTYLPQLGTVGLLAGALLVPFITPACRCDGYFPPLLNTSAVTAKSLSSLKEIICPANRLPRFARHRASSSWQAIRAGLFNLSGMVEEVPDNENYPVA
jgi:hypothetical protein